MTFWIGVACRDHVKRGEEGGFAQLGHGKHLAVKNLKRGDWIAYYSPTSELGGGEKVQAFTSIGRIISDAAYQVEQNERFHPWRVDVEFEKDAKEVAIRPLLDDLDLTRGRGSKWGMAFRAGKIKATDADFLTIATGMGVQLPE